MYGTLPQSTVVAFLRFLIFIKYFKNGVRFETTSHQTSHIGSTNFNTFLLRTVLTHTSPFLPSPSFSHVAHNANGTVLIPTPLYLLASLPSPFKLLPPHSLLAPASLLTNPQHGLPRPLNPQQHRHILLAPPPRHRRRLHLSVPKPRLPHKPRLDRPHILRPPHRQRPPRRHRRHNPRSPHYYSPWHLRRRRRRRDALHPRTQWLRCAPPSPFLRLQPITIRRHPL